MNADFHGKTAVVAGGDPAGQAVALALAREGADVFVCGEHLGELETLAWKEALSIHTEKLPLTDDDALTAFVAAAGERMGAIHVMVCNGRSAPVRKPLTEVTPEERSCAFAETLRTDWKAVLAALPYLERAQDPAVVLLTDSALHRPGPLEGVAAVCAAGVESMTKTLASELASRRIRVNAAALGGGVSDLAGAVLFLASQAASYCTGTLLEAGNTDVREVEA